MKSGQCWKPKPIGLQLGMMRQLFPQFKYQRGKNSWIGILQPSLRSQKYKIRIHFRIGYHPQVFVLVPELSPNAPHIYRSDGSLCLYHPDDGSWSSELFIARTIVPWTAEWLRYYEIWQVTGRWFGPEAPHTPQK